MLNHVNKCMALILLTASMACYQQERNNSKRNHKILEISETTMGKQEYNVIRQQVLDSLNTWCSAKLPGYRSMWSYRYQLDSTLCFNTEKDRMVTAILVQCTETDCESDDVQYFYGAKIKNQWYFFRGGGTMVVIREHYQKDIHTPVSFEKLHELAMNNMLRGYVKKSKEGKWEINDAFFTSLMENVGWGDFDNQSHEDTVAYGKRFTNKKEYFESIYFDVAKSYWVKPKKKVIPSDRHCPQHGLGMVDILKGKIPLGRFYVIAPENACSGEIDLDAFEEVWQYGSNLGEPNADPIDQQDGVAPQCAVKGLGNIASDYKDKRGRAFIPDGEPKVFLQIPEEV